MKAFVAMSGGVDSSVAAALLLEAGHEVHGVSLALWDSTRSGDRVCSDHRDAGRVARALGIPHALVDERDHFARTVVRPFLEDYRRGRTPNPCVACNSRFKLGSLLDWALGRGAEVLATGHYARVDRSGNVPVLRRAADGLRDQSYFLFELSARQLARLELPLGELDKSQVRARARSLGLPTAEKPDSQDLCFGHPADFVRARGHGSGGGSIIDRAGRELGRHEGLEAFTIGQRRGLGIAGERPLYVHELHAETREVVVDHDPPVHSGLVTRRWNWLGKAPDADEPVLVQVRHRQRPLPATVRQAGEGYEVRFLEAGAAAVPGQAAVAYRDDALLGGGWIERSLPLA